MSRVICGFCGLPFQVRAVREGATYYCCSGCALAARIPLHGGQLPISRPLVAALGLGFGLFNEVLFAVLGAAVTGEGRPDVGEPLALVSLVLGAFVLAAALALAGLAGQRRWTDAVAGAIGAVAGLWAGWTVRAAPLGALPWQLAGNLWLAAWLLRGWMRRAFAGRRGPAGREFPGGE
jgi:hypothetical protein